MAEVFVMLVAFACGVMCGVVLRDFELASIQRKNAEEKARNQAAHDAAVHKGADILIVPAKNGGIDFDAYTTRAGEWLKKRYPLNLTANDVGEAREAAIDIVRMMKADGFIVRAAAGAPDSVKRVVFE